MTRYVGFLLILLGAGTFMATGRTSYTALIPAFFGAAFLILALIARKPNARKHVMHAAVAIALVGALAPLPRIISGIRADGLSRPAVKEQVAMTLLLAVYVGLGIKSFIDARRARKGR